MYDKTSVLNKEKKGRWNVEKSGLFVVLNGNKQTNNKR